MFKTNVTFLDQNQVDIKIMVETPKANVYVLGFFFFHKIVLY